METEGGGAEAVAMTVDVTGVPCPANAARVLLRLEGMESGEILEVLVDEGEPVGRLADALHQDGHSLVSRQRAERGWRLLIRRA